MYKKIFITTILILLSPAFALDYSGDFSQRSVIMKSIYNEPEISQDEKDILTQKKLYPSVQRMIEEIKKGNYENTELLLKAKVDPNRSYMSDYPIYIASKYNKTEIAKLLIQYGAKLDMGFYSELYEAVKNKNAELAQYLIDKGAKVNYQDAVTGNTILYLSLKNNMHDISRQLMLKGAKADKLSVYFLLSSLNWQHWKA